LVSVVAHLNPYLPHQVEHGEMLRQGFKRHGIELDVTADKLKAGDVHIVSGPWYALEEWKGEPNVLWLDRTFYGDAHDIISLGWLNPDGSRDFRNADKTEAKGELPELKPRKENKGAAIVFGDYGRDMHPECYLARKFDRCYFKPHPQDASQKSPFMTLRCSLNIALEMADVAIGHASTVLVDAEIAGLHVISTDSRHVVHNRDRTEWLKRLSWAQWSLTELEDGSFWEHLW
jgi:hypothetical protein